MRYRLLASPDYNRKLARFLRVHPDIKPRYARTIELLELNPFHPSLRLHKLSGALEGLCSVSINLAYRITLEFEIRPGEILLVNVGSHDEASR